MKKIYQLICFVKSRRYIELWPKSFSLHFSWIIQDLCCIFAIEYYNLYVLFFLNKTGVHRKYADMTLKILFSLGGLFLQIHFNWIILISILTLLLCPLYERYAKRVAWFRFWAKGSVNVSLWIDNWYMECLET